jgi:hypothetical protein
MKCHEQNSKRCNTVCFDESAFYGVVYEEEQHENMNNNLEDDFES